MKRLTLRLRVLSLLCWSAPLCLYPNTVVSNDTVSAVDPLNRRATVQTNTGHSMAANLEMIEVTLRKLRPEANGLASFLRDGSAAVREAFTNTSWKDIRSELAERLVHDVGFVSPFRRVDPSMVSQARSNRVVAVGNMLNWEFRKWRLVPEIDPPPKDGVKNGFFIQFLRRPEIALDEGFEAMLGYWEQPNAFVGGILDSHSNAVSDPLILSLRTFEKTRADSRELELMEVEIVFEDFAKTGWYQGESGFYVDLLLCKKGATGTIRNYLQRSYHVAGARQGGPDGKHGSMQSVVLRSVWDSSIQMNMQTGEFPTYHIRNGPVFGRRRSGASEAATEQPITRREKLGIQGGGEKQLK